jgi:hypothetical protein
MPTLGCIRDWLPLRGRGQETLVFILGCINGSPITYFGRVEMRNPFAMVDKAFLNVFLMTGNQLVL